MARIKRRREGGSYLIPADLPNQSGHYNTPNMPPDELFEAARANPLVRSGTFVPGQGFYIPSDMPEPHRMQGSSASGWSNRLNRQRMNANQNWSNRLAPNRTPDPFIASLDLNPHTRSRVSSASASNRSRRRATEAGEVTPLPRRPMDQNPNWSNRLGGQRTTQQATGTALVPFTSSANPVMGQISDNFNLLRKQKMLESALGHSKIGFAQSGLLPGSGVGGIAADIGRSFLTGASGAAKGLAGLSAAAFGVIKAGAMTPLVNTVLDVGETSIMGLASRGNAKAAKEYGVNYLDAFRNKFVGSGDSWKNKGAAKIKDGAKATYLPTPLAYARDRALFVPEKAMSKVYSVLEKLNLLRGGAGTIGGKIGLADNGSPISSSRLQVADLNKVAKLEARFDREFGQHNLSNIIGDGPKIAGRRRTYGRNAAGQVITANGQRLYEEALRNIDSKGFHDRAVGDKIWHSAYAHVVGAHHAEASKLFKQQANAKMRTAMRKDLFTNILGLPSNTINVEQLINLPNEGGALVTNRATMTNGHVKLSDIDLNAHMAGKELSGKEIERLRKMLLIKGEDGGTLNKIFNFFAPSHYSSGIIDSNEANQILSALPENVRRQLLGPTSMKEAKKLEDMQSGIGRAYGMKTNVEVDARGMVKLREPTVAGFFQSKRQEMLNRRLGTPAGVESANLLAIANKAWMKEFASAGAFGALDLAFNIATINDAESKKEVMDATVSGMYTATVGAYVFGSGAVGAWMRGGARAGGAVGGAMGRGAGWIGRGAFAVGRRVPGLNLVLNPAMKYGGAALNRVGATAVGQKVAQSGVGRIAASWLATRGGIAGTLGMRAGQVLGGALGLAGPMGLIAAYDIGTSLMDSAYERHEMERERLTQWNAAAHLSTPEAKMILTTERQKASMFARQAGMNFVAAQGEEAVLFHQ